MNPAAAETFSGVRPHQLTSDFILEDLVRLAIENEGSMTVEEDLSLDPGSSTERDHFYHAVESPTQEGAGAEIRGDGVTGVCSGGHEGTRKRRLQGEGGRLEKEVKRKPGGHAEAVTPKLPYHKYKRNVRRQKSKLPENRQVSAVARTRYIEGAEGVDIAAYSVSEAKVARGGYAAIRSPPDPLAREKYTLENFIERHPDFVVVDWDGITPKPLVAKDGKVPVVLCGRPTDATYLDDAAQLFELMEGIGKIETPKEDSRRGPFAALNVGLSYGQGQTQPSFLTIPPRYIEASTKLLENKGVERISAFSSQAFQIWAPKVYNYYKEHLVSLYEHDPTLKERRILPKSVFPAAAFNFGNVWCYKHRDLLNCPFGYCSITALGEFDSKAGGHLVLWEPKVVVEFPYGSTILIPSATITHSNIPVQEGDRRVSFTQYCAGGIFRWVDNSFQTEKALEQTDAELYRENKAKKDMRWQQGVDLMPKLAEILG